MTNKREAPRAGFTPWTGGDNPAPGKRVKVVYRDGKTSGAFESETFECLHNGWNYWKHEGGGKYDIVAYRVVS